MSFDTFNPAIAVIGIFLVAFCAPSLVRLAKERSGWLLALAPGAAFVFLLISGNPHLTGDAWRASIPWAPSLGFNWDVWVTPVGLILALLVTGVGTLVTIYAGGYLASSPQQGRFFVMLFLFMGAMLGLALTENLIVFFVFWELTSVSSFLLIGFYHTKAEARKSALHALLVTGAGGLVLLAGILLLGQVGGSFRLGDLIENREAIVTHPLGSAILVCFIIGAITKSAQVPFHFWLPGAMTAPAPVSAYLHSATMVKAGVFLLALVHPLLGDSDLWHFGLLGLGCLTMTWGAIVAVFQTDLKRLLAFSTVSALGTLVMLLGIEHALAAKAAIVFLIVHAFYKAALFMIAGILEKTTGTREVSQLNGLMRSMPLLGIAAVLSAASMSGLPPFVGFIAKELLYEVKLEAPLVGWGLLICGVTANAANIVVALKVGVAPFLPSRARPTPVIKSPTLALLLGPVLLGLGSLAFGLFPQSILGGAVTGAVEQINVEEVKVKLKLWHGLNLVLLLSAITVAFGLLGFAFRYQLEALGRTLARWTNRYNSVRFFDGVIYAVLSTASVVTHFIQSGNLRHYFMSILAAFVALLIWATFQLETLFDVPTEGSLRFEVFAVVGLIALSSFCLLGSSRRMTSILLLGGIGFGISALFALFGAPDLAITQLLVETLTLVLFALAIYGLPRMPQPVATRKPQVATAVLATLVGVGMTVLTLKSISLEFQEPVSREMAALSLAEAYGRNVVNVTLVDFRALDTLGEIAVLAIASLGVAAILRASCGPVGRTAVVSAGSPVLSASARFTAPAMVAVSIYLLLRGHNEPGGGFIGGLVGAMAVILYNLSKPGATRGAFGVEPASLVGFGLIVALLSGFPGLLTEGSLGAALWGPGIDLPLIGKLKFGTPLLFDIGVYLVVAGIVLLLFGTMQRWNQNLSNTTSSDNLQRSTK